MIVVSNTSPLNYLVLIRATDVLPQLLSTIFIPVAVRDELSNYEAPDLVQTWIGELPDWLYVEAVESIKDPTLSALHQGEREAILLAEKLDADLIILDEQAARTIASQRVLNVIGTLGVLNEAAVHNLVNIPEIIERLRQTTFRASPSLYKWLLEKHRERTE